MAALTTNISNVSLTVSGTTQASTTISWTCPSVPSGVTISSCTLTGTATASMSKGSATITVNGTTVSSGSNFTINLGTGNTTSSVNATAVGNNKNAAGTVTLSNLVYTVNYTEPEITHTVTFVDYDGTILKTETVSNNGSATAPTVPSRIGYKFIGWDLIYTNVVSDLVITAQYESISVLLVKENNNWANIVKIFKKIDGVWVEQANSDWESLFDINDIYNKIKTEYYAILYSDGTFVFQDNKTLDFSHGETVEIYNMHSYDEFEHSTSVPWNSNRANITTVYVDYANPISTRTWFYNCTNLTDFDFNNFDTSNVTDMYAIFSGCDALTSLDVSSFNTSNVTNMYAMFNGCKSLTSLDVSNFDTSSVTNMYAMFSNCTNLTSLDVSNFNTSNVTDMYTMFNSCSNLTSLDVSNFNTSNVTNMGAMFQNCSSLQILALGNLYTNKVTNMRNMFRGCTNLISLDLSSFDTSNVIDMYAMFYGCTGLTSLDISNFDVSNVTNTDFMFVNCTNPDLKIYVKDEAMATWVKATPDFPSTATVIVGSMN